MALDPLYDRSSQDNIERLYRHDLESFVWILISVSMVHNPKWAGQGPWSTPDFNYCRWEILTFLVADYRKEAPPPEECSRWAMSLAFMEWLRAGDGVHLFSTRRNELSNDEVFQEVDKIVSRYWIWD
jgi:hypothetical protein